MTDQTPALTGRVADKLDEIADLLEVQHASSRRVEAYRAASKSLRKELKLDLVRLIERKGIDGLAALPHVGVGIGRVVEEIVRTGKSSKLDRLRGELAPEALFQTIPGVGPTLAQRLHEDLHVDTLSGLYAAAYDGRLDRVKGVGGAKAESIRASLKLMLSEVHTRIANRPRHEPKVSEILDVDREYRARQAELPKIAPKLNNPNNERWLPVLHASRGPWHFTAMFSNTARAHRLGRAHDWVLVYFYDDEHHEESMRTVVSEWQGDLMGKRVVRGREAECLRYYYNQRAL